MPPGIQPQGGFNFPSPQPSKQSRGRINDVTPSEDLDDEDDAPEARADHIVDRSDVVGRAIKRARPHKPTSKREIKKRRTTAGSLKGGPGDVSKEEVELDEETDYELPDSDEVAVAEEAAEETFDLVTLGALASWTDQVVKGIGKDHLEPLLEISEIRGRLPRRSKEIILILAKLIGEVPSDEGLTAKRLVMLLAQLDALAGGGGSADSRLLPLLFQADMEDFPLIRP